MCRGTQSSVAIFIFEELVTDVRRISNDGVAGRKGATEETSTTEIEEIACKQCRRFDAPLSK